LLDVELLDGKLLDEAPCLGVGITTEAMEKAITRRNRAKVRSISNLMAVASSSRMNSAQICAVVTFEN
jgi:multidrug efflux pump subunit AcrB